MKRKLLPVLLALVFITGAFSFPAAAETNLPTSIGAPVHFGVSHYMNDYFYYTFSAPDDLRAIIENWDPKIGLVIKAQLDYRLENGEWHYDSSWDTAKYTLKNTIGFSYSVGEWHIKGGRESLSNMFPDDSAALQSVKTSGWDFPSQPLYFRVRFVTSFDGNKTYVYSGWSDIYTYSKDVAKDPDVLMNHAPTLTSATVEKNSGGMPFLNIKTGKLPGEVQDLNAMAGGNARTEIWMRKAGDKDFKLINESFFSNEFILIDADDYFSKSLQNYDAESYEIKIRYKVDLKKYPQCGRSDTIYSPFSNIFSQNMPAWSDASQWAATELKKAEEYKLIPESLNGADMTKPITREEFAELAVKLYEKVTGEKAQAASPNPFTDTENPQILKAFNLGITKGMSATTFEPDELTNREQVASMLSRAVRVMVPSADFSIAGAPTFTDQDEISSWAVEHVKFMSKAGIIKGTNGKFMPRATTTSQQASGYATTTREQAIAMSVRIFEQY